jgi:hypothetical protein
VVVDTNAATAPRFYRALSQLVPTNFTTTNMVWIPPGTGVMGKSLTEALRGGDEPQHTVSLYDMHGNLSEWCQNWYGTYPAGSVSDPQGPASGTTRLIRGGSWSDYGSDCRSALRAVSYPSQKSILIGFRVVLAPVGP